MLHASLLGNARTLAELLETQCHDTVCLCACPQKRVQLLTKVVERRIQPFVDGDKEGFRKELHREADKLASTPFGVPLMHIIA